MSKKVWKCLGMVVLLPAVVALHAYVFMYLWNLLITDIFTLRFISFWEALGLVAMAKLLFMTGFKKGCCGGRCSTSPKEKFKHKLKDHFRAKYCGESAKSEDVE